MRKACVAFLWCVLIASLHASERTKQTQPLFASVNLCTDQLLLELFPVVRIESLSFLSKDPQYSPNWKKARLVPSNHAQLEELFLLKSPVILTSQFSPKLLSDTLSSLKKKSVPFAYPASLSDLQKALSELGEVLGANQNVTAINASLDELVHYVPEKTVGARLRVLALGPGGYTNGSETIEHELLEKVGFINVAVEAGVKQFSALSLEHVVALQPDVILLGDHTRNRSSASQRFLNHPALRSALKRTKFVADNEVHSSCSPQSLMKRFQFLRSVYASVSA
ncbi:MAG: ABC transporter substrate-binding protein [Pseudomonadota bacterium]